MKVLSIAFYNLEDFTPLYNISAEQIQRDDKYDAVKHSPLLGIRKSISE
jgi:hypothetical protein